MTMKLACALALAAYLLALANPGFACPTIVSRSGWGAEEASGYISSLSSSIPKVFIHHTTGSGCNDRRSCERFVRGVQRYHMARRGWNDIAYNFLIGGDGRVYEGRGWGKVGAHTPNFNSQSIGIAFIGTYSSYSPSSSMISAAEELLSCGTWSGPLSYSYELYGHRQARSTACPGNALYSEIMTWDHWSPQYLYGGSNCNGQCQHTSARCYGGYVSGRCPGPYDVRCCESSRSIWV